MKITRDKWKHFYVGIPLGAVLYWFAILYWPLQPMLALAVASVVLIAICYGFELFSKITGMGHYEIADAIAGIIGGAIGIVVVLLSN
jgi:hypothetical protein